MIAIKNLKRLQQLNSISNKQFTFQTSLNQSLKEQDPEIYQILQAEGLRTKNSLNMNSQENYSSLKCRSLTGSVFQSKYSEGYPGQRYYAGVEYIDQMENLVNDRALQLFRLNKDQWGVNCQAISCSTANLACVTAVTDLHDRVMTMHPHYYGNKNQGYRAQNQNKNTISKNFCIQHYRCDQNGNFDFNEIETLLKVFRPQLFVVGGRYYNQQIEYQTFKELSLKYDFQLMADISGCVAEVVAGVQLNPFEYVDIVTTNTSSGLRGARGSLILYKSKFERTNILGKHITKDYKNLIDNVLFPGLQGILVSVQLKKGGPHNHAISGICTALHEANTPTYRNCVIQAVNNAQVLAQQLREFGYDIISSEVSTQININLQNIKLDGEGLQKFLDTLDLNVTCHTIPFQQYKGINIGTLALSSRGLQEKDFIEIAKFLHIAIRQYRRIINPETYQDLKNQISQFVKKFDFVDYEY